MSAAKELIRRGVAAWAAARLRRCSKPLPHIDGVVLVVAPHPDDETLGCGGLIARQARAGRRVHVVFLTDGEAAAATPAQAAEMAARRRSEALAALAALGVKNTASAATFLGAPDGRLDQLSIEDEHALHHVLVNWITADRPEVICTPYLGGGSSEHDAATRAVRRAAAAAGGARLLEYPVWAWWNGLRLRPRLRPGAENLRLELGELREAKQAALRCHASQLAPAADGSTVLPAALARACCGGDEFFFASRVVAVDRQSDSRVA